MCSAPLPVVHGAAGLFLAGPHALPLSVPNIGVSSGASVCVACVLLVALLFQS